MRNTQYEEDDEIEIDLLELFFELKKKILWILLAFAVGGAAFGLYSKLILVPKYSSTAMMYVLSKETTLTSLAESPDRKPADTGLQGHDYQPSGVREGHYRPESGV